MGDAAVLLRSVGRGTAAAVWLLAVAAALVLSVGTLVVALDIDPDRGVVSFLVDTADRVDVLSRARSFGSGEGVDALDDRLRRTVLVGWGSCAIAYLVVGMLLDRLFRPRL